MEATWDFPGNSGGQIRGVADAGIETFRSDALRALAREVCQNSLDAAQPDVPVRVEFVREAIPTSEMPGKEFVHKVFRDSVTYWTPVSRDAEKFMRIALDVLRDKQMYVMRISDYGTSGLSDPFSRSLSGGWNFLTKVDGGASKGSGTGGSFGIGKNAPFSTSALRTVFYRTLNEHGERAAQGIARLLSFPLPDGSVASGFGYYGDAQQHGPVDAIGALEILNRRTETGTDLFVYGFQGGDSWLGKMEAEVLDNFLVALNNGKLEVKLEDRARAGSAPVILNRETIGKRLAREASGASSLTHGFYDVLTGSAKITKTFTKQIPGLGTARLRVAMGERYSTNRRVLVVRSHGMKLFCIDRFPTYLNFAGVLDLHGDELNDFFREMESAAHDRWEPNRHSDPRRAKREWDALRSWIRETVRAMGVTTGADEIEAAGQTDLLRSPPEPGASRTGSAGPIVDPETLLSMKPAGPAARFGGDPNMSLSAPPEGDIPDETVQVRKAHSRHSAEPGPQVQQRPRTHGTAGSGTKRIPAGAGGRKRVVRIAPGVYRVFLTVDETIRDGRVELTYVGENAQTVAVNIAALQCGDSSVTFDRHGRRIELHNIAEGQRVQFDVRVSENEDYAMRADIYAHR